MKRISIKFNIIQYEEILTNDELYLNIKIFIIIIVDKIKELC